MGDRVSIQFKNGKELSVVLFNHWGGKEFIKEAKEYIKTLKEELKQKPDQIASTPLSRLEPRMVMVDFIRAITFDKKRVDTSLYLGATKNDGDNSDNGHHIIDVNKVRV